MAFALATPPFDLAVGALAGATMLAASLASAARVRDGAWIGLAFGATANAAALRFVPLVVVRFTPLPWPAAVLALGLLAAAQGLAWAAAGAAATALARGGVPRPLAFAAGAYGASFAPLVFPWTLAGALTPWPALLGVADLVGERGAAALLAFAAGLAADAARRRNGPGLAGPARAAMALGVLGAMLAYGVARTRTFDAPGESARVALVQPSIGAATRWDASRATDVLGALTDITRAAERDGVDLTVWHETAYPYALAASSRRCPTGDGALLGPGVHGPVLTGLQLTLGHGEAWNAAAVCGPGDVLSEPYAKRHLLAFGEAVPLAGVFPWLRRAFVRGTGLVPGTHAAPQTAGRIRAGVLVCFEDTLPDAGRDAVEGDPNLLVNVTNDAWFAGTAEPELHLRLAVLRAIEQRKDLVRAVNFGPPSWVDAAGRVQARAPEDVPRHLVVTPTLRTGATFYARAGDAPLAVALALLVAAIVVRRRG